MPKTRSSTTRTPTRAATGRTAAKTSAATKAVTTKAVTAKAGTPKAVTPKAVRSKAAPKVGTKRAAPRPAAATSAGTRRRNGSAAAGGGDAASRREQRRLLQQDLSRAQLLDAAEEVFGAKGFHETTLKEIADLAEFSVGSVYSFFENKDDLFLNVFLRRGAEFLPGMRRTAETSGSPLETLHALADYEVGFFRAHPHFGRLYLRSASTVFPTPDLITSNELGGNFETAMQIQSDVFAAGQAAGVFREGDPVVLARMFSGLVSSYQSLDPAVVTDDEDPVERLPLESLHAVIDGAFRRD